MKDEEEKKVLSLRLPKKLHDELATWAGDDLRSVNAQIEYILSQAVKKRKNKKD